MPNFRKITRGTVRTWREGDWEVRVFLLLVGAFIVFFIGWLVAVGELLVNEFTQKESEISPTEVRLQVIETTVRTNEKGRQVIAYEMRSDGLGWFYRDPVSPIGVRYFGAEFMGRAFYYGEEFHFTCPRVEVAHPYGFWLQRNNKTEIRSPCTLKELR